MSGRPEVRQRRAVGQLDERVDDRLRVHDDVDAVVGRAEQVVGLHHLQALVHQRRRVDRDLAAHRPRRVRERLLDGDVLQLGRVRPRNGPPLAVIDQPLDRARRLAGEQLVQRGVLGVDRHDAARRSPRPARSRARRRRRATPCSPAPGRCLRSARRSSGRGRREPTIALSTRSAPDSATSCTSPSAPPSTSPAVHASAARAAASRVGQRDAAHAVRARLPTSASHGRSGGQADELELVAGARDDVERLGADRPGRAEDEEPLHPAHCGSGHLSSG